MTNQAKETTTFAHFNIKKLQKTNMIYIITHLAEEGLPTKMFALTVPVTLTKPQHTLN